MFSHKNPEEILIILQARLSSKRLPFKMLKPFAGSNLVEICIDKIKKSKIINLDNFYFSVYEEELKKIAKKNGVNIWNRSKESANSEGTPLTEIFDWWNQFEKYKYAIIISACCPLLKTSTIDNFIENYCNSNTDGMLGVFERKSYFWDHNYNLITPWPEGLEIMNTKCVKPTYEACHSLYAGKLSKIGEGIWMGRFDVPGDIKLFTISEKESLDIDTQEQFEIAESFYKSN